MINQPVNVGKRMADILAEEEGVDSDKVQYSLLRPCMVEMYKALADNEKNPCRPAQLIMGSREPCRALRDELRELETPSCRRMCKSLVQKHPILGMTQCVEDCTYKKATKNKRYEACVSNAQTDRGARCVLQHRWEKIADCLEKNGVKRPSGPPPEWTPHEAFR